MTDDKTVIAGAAGGPTVIRPRPGGKRREAPPPPPEPSREAIGEVKGAEDPNPLVGCATPLLTLAWELRNTPFPPDASGLFERLADYVRAFDRCARARGMTDRLVLPARYFLCALLDESVLATPWGEASPFKERGLLIVFHNEDWGGKKFFDAIDRLLGDAGANLELLELAYLCLAMGLEGRFAKEQDGRRQLQLARERVYSAVRDQRGEAKPTLSPRWRGVDTRRQLRRPRMPLWVAGAISALFLMGLFAAFLFDLNRRSDPVFAGLAQVGRDFSMSANRPDLSGEIVGPDRQSTVEKPEALAVRPGDRTAPRPSSPQDPSFAPDLRLLFAQEIEQRVLEVVDRPNGQSLVLGGGELFASGQAELRSAFADQLTRIAAVLKLVPGPILVTGHTDSVPIRTLRFPSNQLLSQARAENVMKALAEVSGAEDRISAEGRADIEPRVPDDPADARNRRVEITLLRETGGTRTSR